MECFKSRRLLVPAVPADVAVPGATRKRHQQLRRGRRHLQRRSSSQVSAQVSPKRSSRLGTLLTEL